MEENAISADILISLHGKDKISVEASENLAHYQTAMLLLDAQFLIYKQMGVVNRADTCELLVYLLEAEKKEYLQKQTSNDNQGDQSNPQ